MSYKIKKDNTVVQKIEKILQRDGGIIDKILFNTQLKIVETFTDNDFYKNPIDTGQLRQSIRVKRTGITKGDVSANKNYATFVEFGTHKVPPRPFMRNGIRKAEKQNNKIIIDELQKLNIDVR